jgi:hypothetical protein
VPVPQAIIERNLAGLRQRIAAASQRAGRSAGAIRLVAVTKSVGAEEVQALLELGVTDFGESRPLQAREKLERFRQMASWHMIGTVQRRKCPEIVRWFDCVDAVDRIEVAEALHQRCEESGRGVPLPILIEVNVSGEASKHGFAPDQLPAVLDRLRSLSSLQTAGLMTMAPFSDRPEDSRPFFARLRELADAHRLAEVSMGMSGDFEVAIEEGATQVRIGSALFKS